MKHANIKNRKSIEEAYPMADHVSYADRGACVRVTQADEDGDFGLDHGFYPDGSDDLLLPVQNDYEDMINWIISSAKEGEL